MEKFILDTNLFFNMEAGFDLGQKTEEVVANLTKIIQNLKKQKKAEFFMSPKAVEEFLSFFEDKKQPFLEGFLSLVTVKSPDIEKITVPGRIIYELIGDVRGRSYRGLQVAEEELEVAVRKMLEKNTQLSDKKSFQIAVGASKKNLRDRYRRATRFGFIDSLTDLELILLAQELNGCLVSADEGVINWGRRFGVKEMPAGLFLKHLCNLEGF